MPISGTAFGRCSFSGALSAASGRSCHTCGAAPFLGTATLIASTIRRRQKRGLTDSHARWNGRGRDTPGSHQRCRQQQEHRHASGLPAGRVWTDRDFLLHRGARNRSSRANPWQVFPAHRLHEFYQIGQTADSKVLARPHYLRWLDFASDYVAAAVVPESRREVKCRNSKRCPELDNVLRTDGARQHVEELAGRARNGERLILKTSVELTIVRPIGGSLLRGKAFRFALGGRLLRRPLLQRADRGGLTAQVLLKSSLAFPCISTVFEGFDLRALTPHPLFVGQEVLVNSRTR